MGEPLDFIVTTATITPFLRVLQAQEGASQNTDADGEAEKPDPDHLFGVLISIKSFIKFLNSHVLSSTTIACKPF